MKVSDNLEALNDLYVSNCFTLFIHNLPFFCKGFIGVDRYVYCNMNWNIWGSLIEEKTKEKSVQRI